jgi:hypothetical protein
VSYRSISLPDLLLTKQSYIWGGLSVAPPTPNVTALNNVYILSIPSFTWVKVSPDQHGNATFPNGHYSASCNMVKSNSQMLVIGGKFPDTNICDTAAYAWGQHNLWTGEFNNLGDDNETYWALFNPNVTTNVIPADIYNVVGGNKNGGATQHTPVAGFNQGDDILPTLLTRRPTFTRTATRMVSFTTSPTSSPSPPPSSSRHLSGGVIAGITIGSIAAAIVITSVWIFCSRRVLKRRKERRQSQMTYTTTSHHSGYGPALEAAMTPTQQQMGYQWQQYPAVPVTELPSSHMTPKPMGEMSHVKLDNNGGNLSPSTVSATSPPAQFPVEMPSPGLEMHS